MKHESRIVEAFKSNAITKILLIDDAYDPPALDDTVVSALADFLDGDANRDLCVELGIEKDLFDTAVDAALEGKADSDELESVYQNLYAEFAQGGMDGCDPGGRFKLLKGTALVALRPLYALLSKCGENVEVRTSGLKDGIKIYREFHPQVLFVDYYLDEDVPATGDVTKVKFAEARRASLTFLREVIKVAGGDDIPAVVLMSTRKVKDVDRYRHEVDDQIMSLRFQFLDKALVKQENKNIIIDHVAADVLLDTSQGYIFGKLLQQALTQWKKGAESALNGFAKEVGGLDLKDFAYLMRFRLREENQPLSEYMEWLFGETLKGLIDEKVDWNHDSFSKLDGTEKIEDKIEGAFEGPSVNIAKLFHRVRVNRHRASVGRRYQLGDLYAQPKGSDVRAVITPDCDLVVRRGKAKVKSVLTMGGTLDGFDKDGSSADDFFFREKTPYSLRWNPKDLETFPINGKESLGETDKLKFVGTLRPLYAQEMQRRALTDLSRVGLPVAPALGINATVTAWIRTKNADDPFRPIQVESTTLATIIPSRAGQKEGHRVLLRRRFFNELIDQLHQIDLDDLKEDDAEFLRDIRKEGGTDKLYDGFLRTGSLTKAKGKLGTGLRLGDRPDSRQDAPWLQIVLRVSDELMEELRTIDPLVDAPY